MIVRVRVTVTVSDAMQEVFTAPAVCFMACTAQCSTPAQAHLPTSPTRHPVAGLFFAADSIANRAVRCSPLQRLRRATAKRS